MAGASAPAPAPVAASPADRRLAHSILGALGGSDNLETAQAAANRLLVALVDASLVDEVALKELGVRGVARIAQHRAQLLLPTDALGVADVLADLAAA